MAKREVPLVPPGEILKEDFMEPLGLSINALARSAGLTPTRISEIIRNRRNITPETAIKLGHFFKTTPQFWMNLQTNYDIAIAQENFVEAG